MATFHYRGVHDLSQLGHTPKNGQGLQSQREMLPWVGWDKSSPKGTIVPMYVRDISRAIRATMHDLVFIQHFLLGCGIYVSVAASSG